jgi:hypothetical protein
MSLEPDLDLAELSIDDLNDHGQQMFLVKIDVVGDICSGNNYFKTPQSYNLYTQRVVLEMYSPIESSCELLKNSSKLMRHTTHFSEELHYSYKAPLDCVSSKWPGVRKSLHIEEELRDDHLIPQSSQSASTTILPSSNSLRTLSASTKENRGYFSWNLSHLCIKSIDVFEGFLQGENINDYDGDHYNYDYEDSDIISRRIELDAHEAECFPVSSSLSPRSSSLIP